MFLLFGIIAFGYAMYTYNFVSDAARDAVRYAIVHGSNSLDPASETDIQNFVKDELQGLDANELTVSACWQATGGSCETDPSGNNSPGDVVAVTVTYDFQPIFGMPDVVLPLSSSSQMVISH
jgi:Flp pilus assembly protein TadG